MSLYHYSPFWTTISSSWWVETAMIQNSGSRTSSLPTSHWSHQTRISRSIKGSHQIYYPRTDSNNSYILTRHPRTNCTTRSCWLQRYSKKNMDKPWKPVDLFFIRPLHSKICGCCPHSNKYCPNEAPGHHDGTLSQQEVKTREVQKN